MFRKFLMAGAVMAVMAVGPLAATEPLAGDRGEGVATNKPVARGSQRPNFLIILADDLGWSDLGAFGGEIHTPHLDTLALAGVRFSDFHSSPTCSPTRAMLLSGTDNHVAGLGTMAEILPIMTDLQNRPGYEGYLNENVASIAERLQEGGYRTLMSGKWHLGLTEARSPAARGFEYSYSLSQGLSNFWGADQTESWSAIGEAPLYRENGKKVDYPEGVYTTDFFTDRLIAYLEKGQADERPFFAYLAYTAPHWPLMAPEENVAKYRGRYDAGYEALRAFRLARQKALGLLAPDARPHDFVGVAPWSSLSAEEKAYQSRKMEVYAGMVDRLDQNVGRVIETLRRLGQYDNTIIIFLSDNGPEGSDLRAPFQIANDPEAQRKLGIENGLANLGKSTSYVGYGPGWAQASSAPSRLMKGYTTEGGTRVVAFASGRGVANGGRISRALTSVQDVAPTLLEFGGVEQSNVVKGRAVAPIRGRSLYPLLTGAAEAVRGEDDALGTEFFFHRGLRIGDWKAVFMPKSSHAYFQGGDDRWRLYNLARDPGELNDLSQAEPEKLTKLVKRWEQYAQETGVYIP